MSGGTPLRDLHSLSREQLIALVEQQASMIARLQEQNAQLVRRVEQLEEKLRTNSSNSSKPPSSDGPASPAHAKKPPSGRKAGGQPGHDGTRRELLPPEKVDKTVALDPKRCERCHGRHLTRTQSDARRHQVTEIPPVRPETTEYRMHEGMCTDCACTTWAQLPGDVPRGAFGPHATAIVTALTGDYNLSRRRASEAMKNLFGLDMSVGSVSASEQQMSAALEKPFDEAHQAAQQQPYAHVDETGWRLRRSTAWLWVMATSMVTVFMVHARRTREAGELLLGKFGGYLITDRFAAYNRWALWMRQICWAHLTRDFRKISERRGGSARIGKALLEATRKMFAHWHRVRDGTIQWATFVQYMRPIRIDVERLLDEGTRSSHAKTRGMCKEILKLRPALWTFIDEPGIEPTNNTAERRIRRGVMWRRTSFGSHSDAGARYVERMLTTTTTLRQQNRNVLAFLVEAIVNYTHGRHAPSLLPREDATPQLAAAA